MDRILNEEIGRRSSLQLIDDSSIVTVAPGQAKAEKRTRHEQARAAIRCRHIDRTLILITGALLPDRMTTNNLASKSVTPQFVCQTCGNFLQHDSSLETLDEQIIKPISNEKNFTLTTSKPFLRLFQHPIPPSVMNPTMNCSKAEYVPLLIHRCSSLALRSFQSDGTIVIRKTLGRKRL